MTRRSVVVAIVASVMLMMLVLLTDRGKHETSDLHGRNVDSASLQASRDQRQQVSTSHADEASTHVVAPAHDDGD